MSKLFLNTGNYKALWTYQKSVAIYDITCFFVEKVFRRGDRTIDQMVQAARSGKQNIVEGCKASIVSAETEIKLIGVAHASLYELLEDYEDYLRKLSYTDAARGRRWEDNSVEVTKMRELCRKHNDSAYFMHIVQTRPPETIANICICLIKQTTFMLQKQMDKLEGNFLQKGGLRERMMKERLDERAKQKNGYRK